MKKYLLILLLFLITACESLESGYYRVVGKDIEYTTTTGYTTLYMNDTYSYVTSTSYSNPRYILWIEYKGRDKKVYTSPSTWNSTNVGDYVWFDFYK